VATAWLLLLLIPGTATTGGRKKFLFPGDTAWFDGLHELATQYGPWDVAAIPIGAYEPRSFMKDNHINVEEAVSMKDAVQAKSAVPIHWESFSLTSEPVLEPRENLVEIIAGRPDAKTFVPWLIGETKQF
jgi:N-acyl-phosphatidylethanolamine-hydrolysing phospholipase D